MRKVHPMFTAITILVNILWLVSPLILIGFGLRGWKQKRRHRGVGTNLPIALGTVLLADWVLFVRFVIQSETTYGMYFKTTWATAALLLLSALTAIASLSAPTGRWQLALAGVLILSLWVSVGYAPAHYLRRIDFASVTVDDHSFEASVYLGHPTDMEAEAFALVRLEHAGGNYLLDFDSERVRPANGSEYVHIPGGVWYLRSMQSGTFTEPLPPRQMNQFRVLSRDGRIITVQF
jgi:hypothetical protein